MIDRAAICFSREFGEPTGAVVARAPGRVCLLGEHTGSLDGFVLATVIDRHVEVIARKRTDRRVRIHAADLGERKDVHLDQPIDYAGSGWLPSVLGVLHELEQRRRIVSGADIVFRGNIPRGIGLGSSTALEVATALAVDAIFNLWLNPVELAALCRDVELRYAGGGNGVVDHFVSRLCREEHALLVDCRNLDARHVPMALEGHRLVILDSGVRREVGGGGPGDRIDECARAISALREADASIISLRSVTSEMLSEERPRLAPDLLARCRHVVSENQRTLEACGRLAAGDLAAFGRLMAASHLSLRNDFEVSHPALDRLVEAARKVDGVLGARLTGGGFGGCTVTLVSEAALPDLEQQLAPLIDDWSARSIVVGAADTARITEVIA